MYTLFDGESMSTGESGPAVGPAPTKPLLVAAVIVIVGSVIYGIVVMRQPFAPLVGLIPLLVTALVVYLLWRIARGVERIADALEE